MKITTKKGDKGETGLFDGKRVSKGTKVIEALGDLDELQSFLGFCKNVKGFDEELAGLVEHLQDDIYRIMSIIGYEGKCPPSCKAISRFDVEFLEGAMDKYDVGDLKKFVRPGVDEFSARFNVARSICRRAERAVVKLGDEEKGLPEEIVKYLNRLSDLLFAIGAR